MAKKTYKEKVKTETEAIQFDGTNQNEVITFGEGLIQLRGDGVLVFRISDSEIPVLAGNFVRKHSEYPPLIISTEAEFLSVYEEKK